jgi:hypothetical protein
VAELGARGVVVADYDERCEHPWEALQPVRFGHTKRGDRRRFCFDESVIVKRNLSPLRVVVTDRLPDPVPVVAGYLW